jgi:hypothetical protein
MMMNSLLGNLPFVLGFMDDVLVFSTNPQEHYQHVTEVLASLRAHKLYAAPDKSSFFQTTAVYLGHLVTQEGFAAFPCGVAAVETWSILTRVKDLRQGYWQGMIGTSFIKIFAAIASPLMHLRVAVPWQ